jgi:hypothetical protein
VFIAIQQFSRSCNNGTFPGLLGCDSREIKKGGVSCDVD